METSRKALIWLDQSLVVMAFEQGSIGEVTTTRSVVSLVPRSNHGHLCG